MKLNEDRLRRINDLLMTARDITFVEKHDSEYGWGEDLNPSCKLEEVEEYLSNAMDIITELQEYEEHEEAE